MNNKVTVYYQKVQEKMANNIINSNIPLSKLAKTSGLSVSTIRNVINKKGIISATTMMKLSHALNMSVDEFVGMKNLNEH